MSRSPEQRWQRAMQYLAQGQVAAARAHLDVLQNTMPEHVHTRLIAARIALHEDRIRDATRYALDAAQSTTDDPATLLEMVEALLRVGEVVVARACLARPPLANTEDPNWLLRLSDLRQRLNEHAESLALIERAVARGASGPDVLFHHGVQLYFDGRIEAAESELEKSLRLAPTSGRAALALSRLRRQTPQGHHLDLIEAGLAAVRKGTRDHAALEFALYKELEDLGRFEDAWRALERGNSVMAARNRYDAEGERGFLERLMAIFDGGQPRRASSDGAGTPIFILGLARSGTTLLERMLGNHTEVASAGELVDFGTQLYWAADTADTTSDAFVARLSRADFAEIGTRYLERTRWRAHGKPFFIDKQPPNWMLAGAINRALPGARVLHLVRDPMDVCFSNWRTFFGDTYAYSYRFEGLATHYRLYQRVMQHWHAVMPGVILDVPYAELVREPEKVMRKVVEFCGLGWQPACLEAQRNPSAVATLSAAQVREPIHVNALGQWRRYATRLAGLPGLLGVDEGSAGMGE
ncbi:MAG TPA: sulfotransferase [Rhodanobacteraceae bacterium]|nr:sulfotransferase [Rhodanobacteraceae bacterium]